MANRLYYALFRIVSALLISDRHTVNTHKGSQALFGQYYIKTGKLSRAYGELYQNMERMREESDYNCAYSEEPDVLQRNLEPAKEMLDSVAAMIKHNMVLD